MKKVLFATVLLFTLASQGQGVIGKWKTIDDKTNQPKSIVEIYENNGKIFGKIIEILNPEKRDKKCDKCTGTDKNKPLLGLVIIKDLQKDGIEYNGGKITDPETGSIYKCFIKLTTKDKLEVRGYIGFALIGRSQTWNRVK